MTIDEAEPTEKMPSMKHRLILMRHGKSDWGDASIPDHDRPLNARGRSSTPMMAQWLQEIAVTPDVVLTSSSTRTCETLDLMLSVWSMPPTVHVRESLYLAAADSILRTIGKDGAQAKTLLVLGHNPGMSHLVSHLADKFIDMPTAAVAIFEVESNDWDSLSGPDDVKLIDFMRPKALR